MRCEICDKELYLGFTCKRCNGHFCTKHRLPENHDCAFMNLTKEEVSLKVQMERSQRMPEVQPKEKKRYKSWFRRPKEKINDEFDDYEDDEYRRAPVVMDFSMTLIIFLVFGIMDIMYFVFSGFMLALIFPLLIHAIFLPILFNMAYKQKRGQLPVGGIITFLKTIVVYMVVYMTVKIVISFATRDYFSATIYIVIGAFMTYMWLKILNQFNKIGKAL